MPTRSDVIFPFRRWGVLIALLLGEMVLVTMLYDATAIESGLGWWADWIGNSREILRFGTAAFVASLLLRGARLRESWASHFGVEQAQSSSIWIPLAAHLAAFAVFLRLTSFVLGRNLPLTSHPGLWALAWIIAALASAGFWLAAAISPGLWWPLARSGASALCAGMAVGLCAAGLGRLVDMLWRPLSRSTLEIVNFLLRLAFQDTICVPEKFLVGAGDFSVRVGRPCCGYEGIGLIWAFLAGYIWFSRRGLRFPHVLALFPIGTALMWFLNAARIAALIAIGATISPAIAMGGFHSQAGWLAFNAVAIGLVLASRRLGWFSNTAAADDLPVETNAAPAFLLPMLSIIAVTMFTAAMTFGFDALYPLRVLVAGAVLWYFRDSYRGLLRLPSWQAVAVGIVTFVVWMALEPLASASVDGSTIASGLARLPRWQATLWLLFRVIGSVVTVPIAEELAFRGYLVRRLISADVEIVSHRRFTWMSFLISSLLFGALHGRWLAGTVAGMAYAFTVYRRGEVVDSIAAHAVTNALIAAWVVSSGSWYLWA